MSLRAYSLKALSVLPLMAALSNIPVMAAWQVDNGKSEFHFVTTKAGKPGTTAIEEVQTFKQIEGKVEDNGMTTLSIDLASVDTGVPIRDQRLKEMLFNVVSSPKAVFRGKVDMASIKNLSPGSIQDVDLAGSLTMCGQSHATIAKLRVVVLANHGLLVETRAPIVVNAADFGIQAGVDALRDVMGLDVLSDTAPVNFSIVLK